MADDRDRADPDSAVDPAATWPTSSGTTTAARLAFGPDGYLYIATGDGGGGGDPLDSGRHSRHAAGEGPAHRHRRRRPAATRRTASPPTTRSSTTNGARQEIWLTGLRNPWRIRFDRATGDLWIGDVGQNEREEIDVARAGVGGLDFGWNVMEGSHLLPRPGQRLPDRRR